MNRMYMTSAELNVLHKLYVAADEDARLLTSDEKELLGSLISQYTKTNKNERMLE